ncbi:MAG TPA: magnesium transporter [Candidatus Udaeobacter sp.]|jgi:magnesium transporter|nr:magnesium transporter [Candidatus Udaeobacter sp.]
MTGAATDASERISMTDLAAAWSLLEPGDRVFGFRSLEPAEADDFFLGLSTRDQRDLILHLPEGERRIWLRLLPPDDAADLLQSASPEQRDALMAHLDAVTQKDVRALLAYAEDDAGGLMSPRYARVRPEMSADEAISYLRRQTHEKPASLNYAYVLDADQRLLGVVSFRQLFGMLPTQTVREIMRTSLITVPESMDQEEVSRLFAQHHFLAIPVVDDRGRMQGVVTADDIVEVLREEATEDIQKIGGTTALGAPYLEVGIVGMIRRRAGWLAVLFLGEMLTATAMGYFEAEIARAVVLALFVPLVISSGGNSGGQATTLVIRAMALGEVRLRDWWRVIRREFFSGLGLGVLLGAIGVLRIIIWQALFHTYGDHAMVVATTVGLSLIGVVMWGAMAGSMLPFILRRLGFDPASASAPFVATLVDVTGLIIYFTTARFVMSGTLL